MSDLRADLTRLQTIYRALERETQAALKVHPGIQCTSGCSQCCKHYGSPLAAPLEWEALKRHWQTLPEATQARVVRNYRELKRQLRTTLQSEEPGLGSLFETPCPFLIEHKCSVYADRPLSCRAFGLSRHAAAEASLREVLFTCNMEMERWERDLPLSLPDLPIKEQFFAQLAALDPHPLRTLLSYLDKEMRDGHFST